MYETFLVRGITRFLADRSAHMYGNFNIKAGVCGFSINGGPNPSEICSIDGREGCMALTCTMSPDSWGGQRVVDCEVLLRACWLAKPWVILTASHDPHCRVDSMPESRIHVSFDIGNLWLCGAQCGLLDEKHRRAYGVGSNHKGRHAAIG